MKGRGWHGAARQAPHSFSIDWLLSAPRTNKNDPDIYENGIKMAILQRIPYSVHIYLC